MRNTLEGTLSFTERSLRIAAVVVSMAVAGCGQATPNQGTAQPAAAESASAGVSAARGEYLVSIAGCHDCHTPFTMGPAGPEPDMGRMLSGHPESLKMPPPPAMAPTDPWNWAGAATNTAVAGPWGVSYAMNLTPDQNTGLGIWTEDMFVNAIRTGKHMATSRPILPPMPWPVYRNMTDDDLKSVFAYLRTVPGIANRIPDPVIAPPPPGAP
jgi:mono/diheme cytochrome c family protein